MPASIAHMLIAQQAKDRLLNDADQGIAKFAADVLEKHSQYMELGSLGPDLPYFTWRSLFTPKKPIGVDQWSYQLHAKSPNIFPLQLIEIAWRESDSRSTDWTESDRCKLSFICGYLTHVAADQIIHPLVNFLAGPYYHSDEARQEHRTCEIHQDLYVLARQKYDGCLSAAQFRFERFHTDCDIRCDSNSGDLQTDEFLYFIQKAFVESHSIKPSTFTLKKRLFFLHWALWFCRYKNWYTSARENLFEATGKLRTNSEQYSKYISLEKMPERDKFFAFFKGKADYSDFLTEAIDLSTVYIRAAHSLFGAPRLDDDLRDAFREVVVNADLGCPLELHVLQTATKNLPCLKDRVDQRWSRWRERQGDSIDGSHVSASR